VHLLHTQIYCCETIYKSLFCAFWTLAGTNTRLSGPGWNWLSHTLKSTWEVQKLHPLYPGPLKNYWSLGGHFDISTCFTVHVLKMLNFKRSGTGTLYLTTRVSLHSHRSMWQVAQLSVLFQLAVGGGPRVLIHYS